METECEKVERLYTLIESFGAQPEAVMKPLLFKNELYENLLRYFLRDTNYMKLCNAVGDREYANAFWAAHNLKETCRNLGFTVLGESVETLTQLLRRPPYAEDRIISVFEQSLVDYQNCVKSIRKYLEESPRK